ncbi:tyrosine-type recombinase/integrase [Paremcibacter congregatus]|uniref:tyrosine-type recombinase/integrase n=1 Tax=Paremcibacter congregatus TaxID=2043170 RepID=UPI003A952B19
MATIRKLANGKWQAQVARNGVRRSKTFEKKTAAKDWATIEERQIIEGGAVEASKRTFADVLKRYAREVSPSKKGGRWEMIRIEKFCRDRVADILLSDLTPEEMGRWRDRRLREVKPGSVVRELNLMSAALTTARREWKWIKENPISDIRKPGGTPGRDRLISHGEIEIIIGLAGEDYRRVSGRVGLAFLFAIETAMRAGEICGLHEGEINFENRVAKLSDTKNGTARNVPLSSRALSILKTLRELPPTNGPIFRLTARQLDANFRKIRGKTSIKDMVFHDTRHEAITRLAKKLDILDLARMVGHKDIRELQTYYNERAEDIAKKLD